MAKYSGWQNMPTIQFKEIVNELVEAKEEQKAAMIIADTGIGKSHAIKQFQAKHPKFTYVFTLGDSYNLMNLLNEVLSTFGLNMHNWKNGKNISLRRISQRLAEIYDDGGKPIFILDEAENAKIPMLKAVKELYDALVGKCSLVLIGTDQLITQLNKKSQGQSVPQVRRRFKAGTRFITKFNKVRDMKQFFQAYIPDQLDLQDLLVDICDNYGELHDYLDSYLRHCQKRNSPVSVEGFRLYHKIPLLKK